MDEATNSSGKVTVGVEDGKSGKRKLKMSYDHPVDERYPLVTLTLPELYKLRSNCTLGTGVTWHSHGVKLTYQQLYTKGMKLAKGLLALGLCRGDTVCSFGVDGPESTLLFIAASSIGVIFAAPAIFVPLRTNITSVLKLFKPKLLIVGNTLTGPNLEDPYPDALFCLNELANENSPFLPAVFRPKGSTHSEPSGILDERLKSVQYVEQLASLGETTTDEKLEEAMSLVTPNEPCLYTRSSGSTGVPKTIVGGAAYFVNEGNMRHERWNVNFSSKYGCLSMCVEEIAFITEVCVGFYTAHEALSVPSFTTWDCPIACGRILEAVEKHRTEMVYCDQYFMAYMVNNPGILQKYDISCMKGLILTGAGLSETFKKSASDLFPDSVDCFGMSESLNIACPERGTMWENLTTTGRALVNYEVKVVDEKGTTVPCQTKGELLVRGYGLFLEYKDEPELTAEVMTSDGWFKTGDCVAMHEDGSIQVVGRMSVSERFNANAWVVYAQPIEKIMKTCSKIKDIVVVGRPTGTPVGDELSYCINLFEPKSMTKEEIYDFAVRNANSNNEWPTRVFFYGEFPRHGARRKVSRKALTKEVTELVEKDINVNVVDYFMIRVLPNTSQ